MRFLALIVALSAHQAAAAPRAAVAVVQGSDIRLGDIVGNAPADVADLVIAYAPAPGARRALSRQQVRARLRDALIDSRGLRIPRRTIVQRASQRIPEPELRTLVSEATRAALPAHVELKGLMVGGGVRLPVGEVQVDVRIPKGLRSGRQPIRYSLSTPDSRPVAMVASAHIKVPEKVLVIRRGQAVTAWAGGGLVTVRAPAVAQAAGAVGDLIPMLLQGGKKVVHGRIINSERVEVQR